MRESVGDFVFVGWDFETFGEHHWKDTGIFDFMEHLPRELTARGMEFATLSEARKLYSDRIHHLPLPEMPTTWAGSGGVDFFLGNSAQQAVFQLMHHAYNKARMTGDDAVIDLATWLSQSDNLHLIQWFGRFGDEAEVSAYFTPREWWELGPVGIITEIQNVYRNFIRGLDRYSIPRQRTQCPSRSRRAEERAPVGGPAARGPRAGPAATPSRRPRRDGSSKRSAR